MTGPDAGAALPLRLEDLADEAVARAGDGRPVVLIDGRSGAGKTTLAGALAGHLARRLGRPVVVASLDDCYPGWHGLAAASQMVTSSILRRNDPGYRRYDWAAGREAEWIALSSSDPLIVEGAGCLTPTSAPLASLRVWADADEAVRRQAALGRDGASYEPWWDVWEQQELAHLAAHRPDQLADVTIDPVWGLAWWHRHTPAHDSPVTQRRVP